MIRRKVPRRSATRSGACSRKAKPSRTSELLAVGFDAVPAAIAIIDRHGTILFVNHAWRQHDAASGCVGGDLGTDYLARCDQAPGAQVEPARRAAAEVRAVLAGDRAGFALDYEPPEQEGRWYRLRGFGFRHRSTPRVLLVHDDVSDARQAQQERQHSAARTRVLAEVSRAFVEAHLDMRNVVHTIARVISATMNDGCAISVLAPDGHTLVPLATHHSDLAARVLAQRLFSEAPWAADHRLVADVPQTGTPARLSVGSPAALRPLIPETHWTYLDRFAIYGILAVPLRVDGRVTGLLTVWRDRPDHEYTLDDEALVQELADRAALAIANARLYTELERRVHERTVQLEAANKELEAFSYSVSHDLRAPLRSVIGFARALHDDYGAALVADAQHLIDRILAGCQRMENLIDDLLGLSRTARAEMHRQPVSLSALAQEIAEELQHAEPERDVTMIIEPEVSADGDARLLRVVLANLLGNAWKYTAKHPTARVEFGAHEQGGERVYFVRDDGAGFDMQYAEMLFGPFQRLHSSADFSGSGIGLATVQRIINRHGGRIWAHAAVERGATFYFTLPGSS